MSKELDVGKECCDIWNKLKDKTKMIDYLIESKKQIADLEAKLVEYKEQIEIVEKQHCELLKTIFDGHKKNFELKQQLAEKEKEIERLREINLDVPIKQMQFHHNQDKIKFAIAKLDKLRQSFIYNYNSEIECIDPYDNNCCLSLSTTLYNTTIDIFDKQIKQLKEKIING